MEPPNSENIGLQLRNALFGTPGEPVNQGAIGFGRRILPMLGMASFSQDGAPTSEPKLLGTTAMTETRPDETTLIGRAAARTQYEATKQQQNLEDISFGAAPYIKEDAKPDDVEEDWLASFFDRGRLISDKEMHKLWSHVLASEINNPGSFSIRTVQLLASLNKSEAMLFRNLCSYVWKDISPSNDAPYVAIMNDHITFNRDKYKITVGDLFNLQDIGLINFHSQPGASYTLNSGSDNFIGLSYHGHSFQLRDEDSNGELIHKLSVLDVGEVMLSISGTELAQICSPEPNFEYMNYVLSWFRAQNIHITTL